MAARQSTPMAKTSWGAPDVKPAQVDDRVGARFRSKAGDDLITDTRSGRAESSGHDETQRPRCPMYGSDQGFHARERAKGIEPSLTSLEDRVASGVACICAGQGGSSCPRVTMDPPG